jgi:hypothetical protein
VKSPAVLQFLIHSNRGAWHLLPCSKALKYSLSEWHIYTIHVSIVSSTLIEMDLSSDINKVS